MKPGVYFGMPEDEYHALDAVGSTALRDVLISPLDCWARHINPDREEPEQTPATLRGTAFHSLLLEGADALASRFYPELNREDHPNVLWSGEELARACGEHGMAKGGTLLERAERLCAAGVPVNRLGPIVEAEHHAEHEGKQILPRQDWQRITRARDVMERAGVLNAFKGGLPEVTIITDDETTGLLCKARIDYLKPRAAYDLKSFANKRGVDLDKAAADVFIYERHHIQARYYADAIEKVKKYDLPTHGDAPPIEGFWAPKPHDFFVIYIQSGNVPNVVIRRVGAEAGGMANNYWRAAGFEIRRGLDRYAACKKEFGDKPWVHPAIVRDFSDEEFPTHLIDKG